jgi:hypothetical protein
VLNWLRRWLPASGRELMVSIFKAMWSRLTGERDKADSAEIVGAEVEYKGYRIRPTPYLAGGQYQTAGIIEKDFAGDIRQHRFIRAERHASSEDAMAFAIAKGRQIIDETGDRLFDPR